MTSDTLLLTDDMRVDDLEDLKLINKRLFHRVRDLELKEMVHLREINNLNKAIIRKNYSNHELKLTVKALGTQNERLNNELDLTQRCSSNEPYDHEPSPFGK